MGTCISGPCCLVHLAALLIMKVLFLKWFFFCNPSLLPSLTQALTGPKSSGGTRGKVH